MKFIKFVAIVLGSSLVLHQVLLWLQKAPLVGKKMYQGAGTLATKGYFNLVNSLSNREQIRPSTNKSLGKKHPMLRFTRGGR